jgi:hypothetical protein
MSPVAWFKVAAGLTFVGTIAEQMLLGRIWQENPCWANSMRLPRFGWVDRRWSTTINYCRVIIVFDPNLRRSFGNLGLLVVAWIGVVLGWSAFPLGMFLFSQAQPPVGG